ncbi:hypothetical protein ACOKM3_14180 [Streptomyces sp. BH106]|uniref:hypothetical protein n=1 Tax=Streptomyces sp. BH106 TaxID=3410409 RepID=UPI003CE92AB7
MPTKLDKFHDRLDHLYNECLDGVREAVGYNPGDSIEGWNVYGLTCANEFAFDLITAWADAHPKEAGDAKQRHADLYQLIVSTFPDKPADEDPSPSWLITYGAATFSTVLLYIEAMRAGRFDPTVPGGIRA